MAFRKGSTDINDRRDDLENVDTFQIMNGVKAIFGRAAWSVNSGAHSMRPDVRFQQELAEKRKLDNAADQQARQLAHLAEWNTQMTTVGGVRMTNAEAQEARLHIIENDEYYADKAVREGRIQASEKDEYKSTVRRIHELKDREGRGIASEVEKQECKRLQESKIGREVENDTGQIHLERRQEYTSDSTASHKNIDHTMSRLSAAPADGSLFQSAPKLTAHFDQATQSSIPLDQQPAHAPQQPDPKVAAMGLGF